MHQTSSSKIPYFMTRLVMLLILIVLIIGLSTTITYYLLQKEQKKLISQLEMYRKDEKITLISPTPTEGLPPIIKPSPMTPSQDLHKFSYFKDIAKKEEFREYGSGKITITYYGDVSSANRELLDAAFNHYWGNRSEPATGPGVTIIKLDGNYAMGKSYAGGGFGYWFGVKKGQWNFFAKDDIKNNQNEIVSCSFLDTYNFPLDFYIATQCS